jgi:hypothetical protein
MPDLRLQYDAIQLYDLGFGPRLVPVTHPDCDISPTSKIHPKDRGKAPGKLTPSGWVGVDVNNPKFRCDDYATAKLWRDEWGANVGFVAGDGWFIVDNDQGEIFSRIFRALLLAYTGVEPLRRYVFAPKHERDAFFMRAVDFVGDGAPVANRSFKFRNGVLATEVQLLASGKQAVIAGLHPGTRGPYVWSRALEGLDQIPVMSVDKISEFITSFLVEAQKIGWVLDGPPPASVSATVSAASVSARRAAKPPSNPPLSPDEIREKILEAETLLDEILNRDVPPGETPTDIDRWLDVYENWISVAYALVAFLGAVLAATPEALALWVRWSDGRAQQAQTSESVWKSVLGQPLRFGPLGLVKLVRSLVPATGQAFPDLDPEDPILQSKTPIWDMLRERWAYCALKGFVELNVRRAVQRQPFADMHAYLKRRLCAELRPGHKKSKPLPSVADLFLEQFDRLEVFDITYAPGDPRFIDTEVSGVPTLNYWRPSTIQARTVSADQVKPWLEHVLFVLGSVIERDRFIKWCAFVVQHPKLKPNWHFLIMSIQGLGKDTMVLPLKLAVGDGNWIEELIYGVASPFNDLIENKLLIVGETAQPKTGHMSAHDVGTRLKPLLAQPPERFTVNKKYKSLYVIPNRIALILFSNELNPLLLDRDQRRVHVVNRRAAKPEPPFYYENLMAWLGSGGSELAAAYLLSYPLTEAEVKEFAGGVAPQTADKIELEYQNTTPQLAALEDILRDTREGVDGTPRNLVATAEELGGWIKLRGLQQPSPQNVRTWLLDMERRNEGVRRLKLDPKAPHLCGVVSDGKHSGRLWLLGEKAPDGREWSAMTNTEIIALWKNLPRPASATIIPFPSADEEPV